ncbi:hypothetical protein OZX73_06015 [Bifidobacterium sp. ESL0775]|uniref:hypothetical protein n=1 Tax=Bifidobacterium sp. ESL0775 TaxID=2983230 RepID=UPI0023F67736|nr:hypothetical protein [Bifidobacterium sp. ESL0775]WEV68842.1 hypothetical protein OZX73_06015 [Bifidobacterium sp. ESL0775]
MEAITAYIRNHRIASTVVALLVVALVGVGAYLGVQADHRTALADCRQSETAVNTAYKQHQATLAKGASLAKDAKKPGELTDKTLLKTVEEDSAKAGKAPKAVSCPAGGPTKNIRQTAIDNRDLAATYTGNTDTAKHQQALVNDMDRTTHKRLDGDLAKAEQLYKDSDGKVADNATRDQLKKAIDHAKAVSKDSNAKS